MTDKKIPAEVFKDMASRLERNDPQEFAGAYVIISPEGTVVSHAFINPEGDESSFWGFVSSTVQIAGTEAQVKAENKFGLTGRIR